MNWLELCDQNMNQILDDLSGLIAIPSKRNDNEKSEGAPFGKACREALDYMMNLGKREGFDVIDVDGYACVLSYGYGEESIGVLGHLDVVPEGRNWTKEPFQLTLEHDVLYGRGVLDDKGPGISAFYALKMIKDAGIQLQKKVMLIFGCDEESGMECMEYYAEHAEVPQMGFVPDADFPVIYGEKGGLHVTLSGKADTVIVSMHAGDRPNIVIGRACAMIKGWRKDHDSLFDFYLRTHELQGSISHQGDLTEIMIEGISAHAAMPYLGENAALHILNFIGGAFHDEFAAQTYHLLHDWQGKPLNIQVEGAYMGFLTMSVGIVHIEGGQAELLVDIRYPNDTDAPAIMAGFQKQIARIQYPLQARAEKIVQPLFVDPDSELVTTLMDVYRSYSKDDFHPAKTMGGGTYAKKLPNFVAFGPEFPNHVEEEGRFIGGPHQRDEGLRLEDFRKAMAIYAEAIVRLAK